MRGASPSSTWHRTASRTSNFKASRLSAWVKIEQFITLAEYPPSAASSTTKRISVTARSLGVSACGVDQRSSSTQRRQPGRKGVAPIVCFNFRQSGAPGRTRTGTPPFGKRRILSPLCLPVSPPGLHREHRGSPKDRALDRSMEAGVGIEPASTALQAAA
jgi:hypothetical protein